MLSTMQLFYNYQKNNCYRYLVLMLRILNRNIPPGERGVEDNVEIYHKEIRVRGLI
jgi:hypothetical protein